MAVLHLINCVVLAFGPYAIYYKATPLSDYGTMGVSLKTAVVYLVATVVKTILWATILGVSEDDVGDEIPPFEPYQEVLKCAIGLVDLGGLYVALTQLVHRSVSFNHKFQAVALGWAMSESLMSKLVPIFMGASGLQFTWQFVLEAIESNTSLVLTLSLTALCSLLWLRKLKPAAFVPLIYFGAGAVFLVPFLANFARRGLGWGFASVVGSEVLLSVAAALWAWWMFIACQKPASS